MTRGAGAATTAQRQKLVDTTVPYYFHHALSIAGFQNQFVAFTGNHNQFGHLAFPKNHGRPARHRSEEHTSELQSLMRSSYAVFCLKKKNKEKHKKTEC